MFMKNQTLCTPCVLSGEILHGKDREGFFISRHSPAQVKM
jgi:hypothetical protein